jgi:hypothetical protein
VRALHNEHLALELAVVLAILLASNIPKFFDLMQC